MLSSPGKLLLWLLSIGGAFALGLATSHFRWTPYRWVAASEERSDDPIEVAAASPSGKDRRPGLWHVVRTSGGGEEPDREALEELAGLPYMSGYEVAGSTSGVTRHDPQRSAPGLNLIVSGHAPEAILIDGAGNLLHRWAKPLAEVWPEMARQQDLGGFETFWRRAHVLPGGELLAIYDGIGLVKLDPDSEVVWADAGGHHHDLFVDESGAIHALARRRLDSHENLELDGPIDEDFVRVHSSEGGVRSEWSVLEAFLASDWASLLSLARREGDILHTNTIELMDGRFAERHPLYRRGNVLLSVPRLDTVAVVDPLEERVIWAMSGMFRFQHQPTMLDNGNFLIFDNTGRAGDSRVLEIDPVTQSVAWRYDGPGDRRFTSYFLGSVQPLKGGNVLVTESTAGRAFEIDREGEIVWEYVNPERAGDRQELVASLLEVVRLPTDSLGPEFLSRLDLEAP